MDLNRVIDTRVGSLRALAEEEGFECRCPSQGIVIASVPDTSGVLVRCEVNRPEDFLVAVYVRTDSSFLHGERTDANEMLSMLVALFLRHKGVFSSVVLDVPHPAVDIATEVYARYLIPAQPHHVMVPFEKNGLDLFRSVLKCVGFVVGIIGFLARADAEEDAEPIADWEAAIPAAEAVAKALGEELGDLVQFTERYLPRWFHYRSVASGVTIYKSPAFSRFIASLEIEGKQMQGVEGTIFLSPAKMDGSIRNVVSFERVEKVLSALKVLNGVDAVPVLLPIEDHFAIALGNCVAFVRADCGLKAFFAEKARVRERHVVESEFLFAETKFVWAQDLSGARFEELVRELLSREPGVKRVRFSSVTKEPDGGRDLVCSWETNALESESVGEEESPFRLREVVVQCKALRRTVDKSDVKDILDTTAFHDADGFFLAVASKLSRPLIDTLEGLRRRVSKRYNPVWTDWWTHAEIEDRLRKHPEVASRYLDLVREERPPDEKA
jgi:hypothetical protein